MPQGYPHTDEAAALIQQAAERTQLYIDGTEPANAETLGILLGLLEQALQALGGGEQGDPEAEMLAGYNKGAPTMNAKPSPQAVFGE